MGVSNKTIAKATKWSMLSGIGAKLVSPISSMILARLLAPSVYGIVASVNMVLTFCELFADAGFNKYIIQHEVKDEGELNKIINIAFWTNFVLTMAILGIICLFASPIASFVGCPGKELALIVACVNLPLHGFYSIQSAKLNRNLDFKSVFFLRMVTLAVPFVVTIPVAIITRSYWAFIIGNIASTVVHVIALAIKLKFKPSFYFSFSKLKEMFSFSIWSMVEAFLVWFINWGDVFIVTQLLTQDYLGIYKTSMNMVGQITGIISSAIVPVHLSSLAKLQNDDNAFRELFYRFSVTTGIILVPMGMGMFIYRELMCSIALGSAWSEGATLMGIWGLITSIAILFNSFNGNVLIARGKPKVSVIVQIAQILVIMPAVYFSAKTSFECLSYTRALVRVVGMVIFCITVWKMYRISCFTTLKRLTPVLISTAVMSVCGGIFTSLGMNIFLEFASVLICICVYFAILLLFPSFRKQIISGILNALKK